MDISRQLPAEVSSLAGESEAVAILHRTLVNLREELIKRDNRIHILESKISNENLASKGKLFCLNAYIILKHDYFGLFPWLFHIKTS